MILQTLFALAAAQANMDNIDVPYQALPAIEVYSSCISARIEAESDLDLDDPAEFGRVNSDALAACARVREEQLARALELVTDFRPYGGSRGNARAAVRRAFERYGQGFVVVPDPIKPPTLEEPEEKAGDQRPC